MNNKQHRFRYIFILEPAHDYDFSSLYDQAEQVRFLTSGRELDVAHTSKKIGESLAEFDANQDALVATGRVYPCILLGIQLAKSGITRCKIGRWDRREHHYYWEVLNL